LTPKVLVEAMIIGIREKKGRRGKLNLQKDEERIWGEEGPKPPHRKKRNGV